MVFEKVREIIVDALNCDIEKVTMGADLRDDLEADSLDAVELVIAVEEEYDIEVPDEVAMEIKTVKDIVTYIESQI